MESKFITWLAQGESRLEMYSKTTIERTLSLTILTMLDGRTIVVVEDTMVSFDGFYETFTKDSEVYRVIKELKNQNYFL